MATVTIFAAIWGYKFLKGQNFLSADKHFHAYYDYADQLNVSAAVFVKGLEVGTVTNIQFVPGAEQEIKVEFTVDKDIQVHKNTIAYIFSTGILGGKAIKLSIPGPCTGEDCAESGDELDGKNMNLITSMLGEKDLEKSIDQVSKGLTTLIDSLDHALAESETREGIGSMIRDLQNTLHNISEVTATLNKTLADPGSNFNQTLDNLADISKNIKESNKEINEVFKNFASISSDLKEANVGQTVQKANSAIDQTTGTMATLETRLEEAKKSIEGLNSVISRLENGEGTLGKLLMNEDVYNNIQRSSKNLDLLLQDIRLNPNRYIKVSVFGGKTEEYKQPEEDPAFDQTGNQE